MYIRNLAILLQSGHKTMSGTVLPGSSRLSVSSDASIAQCRWSKPIRRAIVADRIKLALDERNPSVRHAKTRWAADSHSFHLTKIRLGSHAPLRLPFRVIRRLAVSDHLVAVIGDFVMSETHQSVHLKH
jgi:hypothetical protein